MLRTRDAPLTSSGCMRTMMSSWSLHHRPANGTKRQLRSRGLFGGDGITRSPEESARLLRSSSQHRRSPSCLRCRRHSPLVRDRRALESRFPRTPCERRSCAESSEWPAPARQRRPHSGPSCRLLRTVSIPRDSKWLQRSAHPLARGIWTTIHEDETDGYHGGLRNLLGASNSSSGGAISG